MLRRALLIGVIAALSSAGWAQERPEETMLTFHFKDASVDAVLQYVSSVTGWIFTQEKETSGKITAYSDTKVPASKCLDFLNAAFRPHGLAILNPYSPGLPKAGHILKVLDVSEALKRNVEIYAGSDPDEIPLTDQVRTQIIPLRSVNVVEVNKELGDLLKSAVGTTGKVAISTYSNSVILTGRSDGINRVARILRVIDVRASGELKIRIFMLKNADAAETAKTLNEVFKQETTAARTGSGNPIAGFLGGMFSGRSSSSRSRGSSGPQPRALAHQMVRITAEPRTNAVIVSATEENLTVIDGLIQKLDDKASGAIELKVYALRFADATNAAQLINDLFAEKSSGSSNRSSSSRSSSSSSSSSSRWMSWMRSRMGGGSSSSSPSDGAASRDIRAVPDVRTNSILIAASAQRHELIADVVMELDRPVEDMLEVKIYKLQNADPEELVKILESLFRPQVEATSQSGRSSGSSSSRYGSRIRSGGTTATGSGLLPSQEVEITADTRTRRVIVKASREYIKVMDEVVRELDADPTESTSIFVVRLRNNDAISLAETLQRLVSGNSSVGSSSSFGSSRTQQNSQFGSMQQQGGFNNRGFGGGSGGSSSSTRGGTSSRTRTGNLGPLDVAPGTQGAPAQEPPAQPQSQEPRRGLEGQVDIQPDPSTNSLVIRTSPRNFEAIQEMLRELDRLRPQVLIKVLIVEVTLDESTQFGLEGFWENRMTVRGGDSATQQFSTDFSLATQGFSYLLSGDEFQATLNLFAEEGKLRVLATPRILALDNESALINVGKEVPRVTNTFVNDLGNTTNSVTYENIGIMLEVIPHINPDGLVTMFVAPEISDVASESEAIEIAPGVTNPTFNVNRAQTTVAVRTGTTVVIGGLIRETTDETVEKIPFLGDIPILGYLFSRTSTQSVRRELMIFLTPYVAYTSAQLEEITELEKSRLKLIDPREVESESDRWLERIRK